jgi:fructose-1,6-bisphosphatase II / sedoheptulose-1,7-bisphosphatase
MADKTVLDRNLALEVVRVTEAAALSASRLMGRGDEKAADQAAVDAMRRALNSLAIEGVVVIGEGERDEAPMLYIGEKVGMGGGPRVDIALDPLEGTTLTAKGGPNALAVIAMAEAGGFLNAPDVYMDKLAVGGGLPEHLVDIDASPAENLKALAKATKREVSDLVVCILDRPRHVEQVRRSRNRASTCTWARAARPRACSPRRRCAASAASSRGGCCSATTTSAAARAASASPTSTASTTCSSSRVATSCSRRRA